MTESLEALEKVEKAIKGLLARDQRNTCPHEETTRGGTLWTICTQCKAMWADDEGGMPEWKDPPEWEETYEALSLLTTIRAALSAGAAGPAWGVWVDYNHAPPGSYACLVSSFVDGNWTEPDARWMPAHGRPHIQGQVRVMPHLMPGDPLTRAAKET